MAEKIRALVADRDTDTRVMYAEHLRATSYDVEEAEDGREALAKAMAQRPGVIVTDMRLPGISGVDLCRLLRDDTSTTAIPIVVTADSLPGDVELARAAGADTVLVKPCLPERLAAEIQAVVARSRELRARGSAVRENMQRQLAKSQELFERSRASKRSAMLSHSYARRDTSTPSIAPPSLRCPACDAPLRYLQSHVGGVSARHPEQWDYFSCPGCAATFEYRQRTRKLRSCPASMVQALTKSRR